MKRWSLIGIHKDLSCLRQAFDTRPPTRLPSSHIASQTSAVRWRPFQSSDSTRQRSTRYYSTRTIATAMDSETLKQYLADSPPAVVQLEIAPHFNALTEQQKLYAHHLSRACWEGGRVSFRQLSPEAEGIYDLIIALHTASSGEWEKYGQRAGVSEEDVNHFLDYAAQFLGNAGNYKGFGDSKFIPRISPENLEKLVAVDDKAKKLYDALHGTIHSGAESPAVMHLGYPAEGHLSSYYLGAVITQAEIEAISKTMAKVSILPENTRVRKVRDGQFELLIASGIDSPPKEDIDSEGGKTSFDIDEDGVKGSLTLKFGDYKEEMSKIALEIKKAEKHAANDGQKTMLDQYAKSFGTGSLEAYKKAQIAWVKDIGPMVETNIGFVETYRDPAGVRGEWEGFVAMVNQERTRAFGALVNAAPSLIPLLPWGSAFEKDKFTAPDFTSLEVLTFATGGPPGGINIPNYDDIRQNVGFKNVSLGNVIGAKAPDEKIPFVSNDNQTSYAKYRDPAFEVQVGIHELLGHGSGKLLQETSPGVFNFDHKNPPTNPITNKPVTTYYKPGQTWSSVFGATSSSYEECRAEAVAMHLACDFEILKIFGLDIGTTDLVKQRSFPVLGENIDEKSEAFTVLHTAYTSMARAGIAALEFWDPRSKKWGQAHMQARFSILKAFLEASTDKEKPFCKLATTPADSSSASALEDLIVEIDPHQILTTGRTAVAAYLQKLHVYKATADVEEGIKLYDRMTHVDEWFAEKVRPLVLKKKVPRKIFVQANTVLVEEDGKEKVVLKEYEATTKGMIQSFAERHI